MTDEERPLRFTKIPGNFIYPDLTEEDFRFGSGQLTGTPLRADGDWREYLPPEEDQNVRGIESSACFVEASQHAIATIEEEEYGEVDNNYAARFNALLAGGTPTGGSPIAAADSMRHDGLVRDSVMPFGPDVRSWGEFHSWKGVNEKSVRSLGKEYLETKELGYDVVVERHYDVKMKYQKLRDALKYSPCPVSVVAWYERDGIYYKPAGLRDTHLVELVYIDDNNQAYVRDTYAPYLKQLEPFFDFDFGMRWSVEQKESAVNISLMWRVVTLLLQLLALCKSGVEYCFPPEPAKPVPDPKMSAREWLYQAAVNALGSDASPNDSAPDELGCAESLTDIIAKVKPKICWTNRLATASVFKDMVASAEFAQVGDPMYGDIIISPTKWDITGHCGIVGTGGAVMSNNSFKDSTGERGIFSENYTLASWQALFGEKKGLRTYFFRLK